MKNNFDVIVVGAGYAGSIMAREFAEIGKKVCLIERRPHIAGNMFDKKDANGILTHQYGPHISHFKNIETLLYLEKYSDFVPYQHHVLAEVKGKLIPLPFNLSAIDILYSVKDAIIIKQLLISEYGMNSTVPIIELRKSKNKVIKDLAEFIFENIFLHYTSKMWGLKPSELDPAVTARIPVRISYDNRHFTDEIQVMPKYGYTKMFNSILDHKNITIKLNTEAKDILMLSDNNIFFQREIFNGILIYTGPIDELLENKFGKLPYRSLYFQHETHQIDKLQQSTTLNWPDKRSATRRTENKLLNCQPNIDGVTSTITEYPGAYNKTNKKWNEPYYPIPNEENFALYEKYKKLLIPYKNLFLVGRLAEYKYYDMEAIVLTALKKFQKIKSNIK